MTTKNAFDFPGHRTLLEACRRKRLIEITVTFNGTATPAVTADIPGITAALSTGVTTLSGCPAGDADYARIYPVGLESRASTVEMVSAVHFDAEADTLHFTTLKNTAGTFAATDPASGDKAHLLLSYGMKGQ